MFRLFRTIVRISGHILFSCLATFSPIPPTYIRHSPAARHAGPSAYSLHRSYRCWQAKNLVGAVVAAHHHEAAVSSEIEHVVVLVGHYQFKVLPDVCASHRRSRLIAEERLSLLPCCILIYRFCHHRHWQQQPNQHQKKIISIHVLYMVLIPQYKGKQKLEYCNYLISFLHISPNIICSNPFQQTLGISVFLYLSPFF